LHYKKWFFIIVNEQDGIIIKQITAHNVEKKTITIHSLNEMYPDKVLHLAEIKQIYNVVQMLCKSKFSDLSTSVHQTGNFSNHFLTDLRLIAELTA